jgi:hypothetical protein
MTPDWKDLVLAVDPLNDARDSPDTSGLLIAGIRRPSFPSSTIRPY